MILSTRPLHDNRVKPGHRTTPAAIVAVLLTGCTAGPLDIAGSSLQRGMVAHWPLDEASGAVAADRSGNGHHGTVTGGTWIAGRFGGALHFEAGNEVAVPAFPQATATWSVALWARPPMEDLGASYVTLISTEVVFSGGWQMNLMLTPTDTHYQFSYWRGPEDPDYFSTDCACVDAQQWTHLAGVVDSTAGTMSFYKNGAFQSSIPVTQPIKTGSPTLYMGRWSMPERLFKGDLDDIVIYDRVLSTEEVLALAQTPAPARR